MRVAEGSGKDQCIDCPSGELQSQCLCAPGAYGSRPGLTHSAQCTPCDEGKHCETPGLTAPTSNCSAGFYCRSGAFSATPLPLDDFHKTEGDNAAPCDPGFYCPEGSGAPVPCPPGTIGTTSQAISPSDCSPCPGGKFCTGSGRSTVSGRCAPGFFCGSGAKSPKPDGSSNAMNGICTPGHECPLESSIEVECPYGTYSSIHGASFCNACPAGMFCAECQLAPSSMPRAWLCVCLVHEFFTWT